MARTWLNKYSNKKFRRLPYQGLPMAACKCRAMLLSHTLAGSRFLGMAAASVIQAANTSGRCSNLIFHETLPPFTHLTGRRFLDMVAASVMNAAHTSEMYSCESIPL